MKTELHEQKKRASLKRRCMAVVKADMRVVGCMGQEKMEANEPLFRL